jgi:hypothetical protein
MAKYPCRNPKNPEEILYLTYPNREIGVIHEQDASPGLLTAVNQAEMQASVSTTLPLGDHATLQDLLVAHATPTAVEFRQWGTMNQVPPRTMMQIELQAAVQGIRLAQDPPRDPRMATSTPPEDPVQQTGDNLALPSRLHQELSTPTGSPHRPGAAGRGAS